MNCTLGWLPKHIPTCLMTRMIGIGVIPDQLKPSDLLDYRLALDRVYCSLRVRGTCRPSVKLANMEATELYKYM